MLERLRKNKLAKSGQIDGFFFISFLVPIVLLSIVYLGLQITPFGQRSLLTIDLYSQYISFFAYLKNALLGHDNLAYSFSKTMSGNMLGLVGYYLISPFNFLFLLSETANFPFVVTLITLLKTGAAGLTMHIYLSKKQPQAFLKVALSSAYALSSYLIVYQQNIMWLDGVILLPLVILGIDQLFERNNPLIYPVFLSLAIITNYYIGFMICIFSVIYFIASYTQRTVDEGFRLKEDFQFVGVFLVLSLLAGGVAAFIWLPAMASYSGNSKVAFDWATILTPETNFVLVEFLSKFIIGATNRQQIIEGLPNVFIPTSFLLLVIPFFVEKNVKPSTKLKYGILVLSMYFSFNYVGFNRIWHGFSEPTWFPFRNSFIFSFLLISIVSVQLKEDTLKKKTWLKTLAVFLTAMFLIYLFDFSYLTPNKLLFTFLMGLFSLVLLRLLYFSGSNQRLLSLLLLVLTFADSTLNGYLILKTNWYADEAGFQEFVSQMEPLLSEYTPAADEFYRLEKTFEYTANDPLLLNYPGLSHYSSNETEKVKRALGDLGYRGSWNWAKYGEGSSWLADSLMGIKYRISEHPRNYLSTIEERAFNYKGIERLSVQENPSAFPLGFLVQENKEMPKDSKNAFDYQNHLISALFNSDSFYTEVATESLEPQLINVAKAENNSRSYVKIDEEAEAFIVYTVKGLTVGQQLNVFFESDTLNPTSNQLFFDGQLSGEVLGRKSNTIHSLTVENETIEVQLKLKNEEVQIEKPLFYLSETDDLMELFQEAEENKIEITHFAGNHIVGKLPRNFANTTLLLTIPYDEGWQVKVDGNEVKTHAVADLFLGAEIPEKGTRIEMKYSPPAFKLASVLSIASAFLLLLLVIRAQKRTT